MWKKCTTIEELMHELGKYPGDTKIILDTGDVNKAMSPDKFVNVIDNEDNQYVLLTNWEPHTPVMD